MTKIIRHEISGKNLIYWLIATVGLMFALVIFIFIDGFKDTKAQIKNHKHDLINDDISASLKYYNESMSMSVRLFAFTHEEKWKQRYLEHEKQLSTLLVKVEQQARKNSNNLVFETAALANKQIKNTEMSIISNAQKQGEGVRLLDDEYIKNKQDYALLISYLSDNSNNAIRLNQLQSQIHYIDEILTMSARMAAFTGDSKWKNRYDRMVIILDASIAEALERTKNENLSSFLSEVSMANTQLITLEEQAFNLVGKNKLNAAVNLLFGDEYQRQKEVYAQGIAKFSTAINEEVNRSITSSEQYIQVKAIVIIITLSIFTIFFFYLTKRIKNWEMNLENRNIELEKKKNELEIFSYSMSHDLKAPLKSIQGFSKRIDKYLDKERFGDIKELNSHVISNAVKLDKLVDDIMGIIKAEKIDDLVEEVDFSLVSENISSDISALDNTHNVQFIANFNHYVDISCHRQSLYQILTNLVSNAVKYAKSDINDAFVKLETSMHEKNVLKITVSDNGIGISKEVHDRVFTMFFRESSNISFGTGLGLYLVKKQIENMNGSICFSSDKSGTVFTILLPILPIEHEGKDDAKIKG